MRRPELLLLPPCLFITAWVLLVCGANATTDQDDISALNVFFSSLSSPSQLTRWSANGGDPCAESWKGVTCTGSQVTELRLSNLGLNGGMAYNLDKLKSLTYLDLSINNIGNGNQIPYQLPPKLKHLDLSQNNFGGEGLPYSINQMTSLEFLSVRQNQLKGAINDMFYNLGSLREMDLSSNQFSGSLPRSFSSLLSLTTLFLQDNQFSGTIDVLKDLPLERLNVANNRFNGWIPEQLKHIRSLQTDGNSWNNGPAPPSPPSTYAGSGNPSDSKGKSGLSGGGIAGIIISLLVVGLVVAFFIVRRKSKKSSPDLKLEQDQQFAPLAPNESNEVKPMQTFPDTHVTVQVDPPTPVLKPPPVDRPKSFDDKDNDLTYKNDARTTNRVSINAVMYSVADLQMATGSFSVENLLGEGSIGRVFKAQFDDGKVLAVKKVNSSVLSSQASDFFLEVVSDVSRLHHPNVSQLVGYCSEHGQHLLVYEFHRNGSLHDFLHLSDEYNKPLTWNTRVKIALGSARALEYLHEVSSPSVVHKNFKSANILLDGELNPHISDSGLSKLAATMDYQALDQYLSSGYSAPEVAMSGHYTLRSDVFSFGVVMLELLTGRKPFDSTRPRSEQSLVRWATPQLHDIDALDKMVDPALKGLYPAKSLSRFADVIALCVQAEPEFRPPMSEVVQALVRLVQRANMSKHMGAMDDRGDYLDAQDM